MECNEVGPAVVHGRVPDDYKPPFYHGGLCEVLVCRFTICHIRTCIVYFIFPVKNITHDKFDNLDYLCWCNKDL